METINSHLATSRDMALKSALPHDIYAGVSKARVLVVGAGGIGCELLKNLVLSGFRDIELVDLDTIDISNLNRQFLFQNHHISQPKALVAAAAASKFNPGVRIVPHFANIKDRKFDLGWFQTFDIVMNALDNLDARRYVNGMCLDAKVPLIESGTAGYVGQTTVICKGRTECFECNPKETPKTYPVCTIRSTPSQPIHCVVWAKSYLFNQLFGEDDDPLKSDDPNNRIEIEELKREAEALRRVKDSMGTVDFCPNVFDKVFGRDITRLASCKEMWKDREAPCPLSYNDFALGQLQVDVGSRVEVKASAIPTLSDSFWQFKKSTEALAQRLLSARADIPAAVLSFDKDDADTLEFVVAASNLRAHVFGIPKKSWFDVKGNTSCAMAGNIIPAIATTNAIIAGAVVMQAFKILQGKIETCHTTFLVSGSHRARLLCSEALAKPNPNCSVCISEAQVLSIDNLSTFSIRSLVDGILPQVLELLVSNAHSDCPTDLESGVSWILHDPDVDNYEVDFASLSVNLGSKLTVDFDHPALRPLTFIVQFGTPTSIPNLTPRSVLANLTSKLARPLTPDHGSVKHRRTDACSDDLMLIE
ncbi:E1 ubiquitin-activating protein uba2 [Massospora cicadina]|nr:E1 ubiquitin-activating protein uba2 [Massospora cicadina]